MRLVYSIFIIAFTFSTYAEASARKVIARLPTDNGMTVKSLPYFPIGIYVIDESAVQLEFYDDVNLDITIRSLDTGALIYTNSVSAEADDVLDIDMSWCELGNYEISISYNSLVFTGQFELCQGDIE